MWDEWAANKDHSRDNLGPGGQVQLYVRTDIEILEDDVYTKGKEVKRGDKLQKDVSEEQLIKMRRRMQTGLENVGGEDSLEKHQRRVHTEPSMRNASGIT